MIDCIMIPKEPERAEPFNGLNRAKMNLAIHGADAPLWCQECQCVWDLRKKCVYCGSDLVLKK